MQTTLIQSHVAHTVTISLHELIMEDVSKHHKLSYVFSPVDTLPVAKNSHDVNNQVEFKCKCGCSGSHVVHAGSLVMWGLTSHSAPWRHKQLRRLFNNLFGIRKKRTSKIHITRHLFVRGIHRLAVDPPHRGHIIVLVRIIDMGYLVISWQPLYHAYTLVEIIVESHWLTSLFHG